MLSSGVFFSNRAKKTSTRGIVLSRGPITTCLRVILCMSLCIILSGDVETNPGPTNEEILIELREFRTANEGLLKDLKGEMTSLRNEVTTIRRDLDVTSDRIEKVDRDMYGMYDELKGDIFSIGSRLEKMERQVEHQEAYSRRENLLFHGMPQDPDETKAATKEKVLTLLNNKVTDRTWSSDDFVDIHRLRTRKTGPQPIIARFLRSGDKFSVLNSRQKLKDDSVGVSTDLTHRQWGQLQQLRDQGKQGHFERGKLIVHNHPTNSAGTAGRQAGNTDGQEQRFRFGQGIGGFSRNNYMGDRRSGTSGGQNSHSGAIPNQSLPRNDSLRSDSAAQNGSGRTPSTSRT